MASLARSEAGMELLLDAELHLAQLVADVSALGPGPIDGIILEAGDDVPVDVVDRLARGTTVVDDHIQPVGARGGPDRAAEAGQEGGDVRGEIIGELAE